MQKIVHGFSTIFSCITQQSKGQVTRAPITRTKNYNDNNARPRLVEFCVEHFNQSRAYTFIVIVFVPVLGACVTRP